MSGLNVKVPQGSAQHGCKQIKMALIYPDGCLSPAGHQNKDVGWFPHPARWEGLFSSQETKGGLKPRQWTQTQNVGNKRTRWWENMQLCSCTCPPQHFHLGPNLASPRGSHTAALGIAEDAVPKLRSNPGSAPWLATSLVFNIYQITPSLMTAV